MRKTFLTLVATCCLSVLALPSTGLACDKDKDQAAGCGSATPAPTVLEVVSGDGATCSKSAKTVTVAAKGDADCPGSHTVGLLMAALGKMDGCCPKGCGARDDVALAVRTMAKAKPGLVSDVQLASLTTGATKTCGGASTAKTIRVVSGGAECDVTACQGKDKKAVVAVGGGGASTCGSAAAPVVASVRGIAGGSACGSTAPVATVASGTKSSCGSADKAPAAVLAVGSGSECSSAKDARFVAFGCDKSDRIARAAAMAYVSMLREIKLASGAEGCAAKTASELLASVLDEMQAERTAAAEGAAPVATAVSFGALGDCVGKECPPECCASKK